MIAILLMYTGTNDSYTTDVHFTNDSYTVVSTDVHLIISSTDVHWYTNDSYTRSL